MLWCRGASRGEEWILTRSPAPDTCPVVPPRCRRAWTEPVLRRRGASRGEEWILTRSPAPDACPVARLDLRKTGRKQQDSGRRGRRLLAPQPRDGARAGSPEPQARRCPLARTPHYTLRQYRPHAPGRQRPRTSYRCLALARGAPRRGDRSPLVVTGHAERPPDFVSAVTHRGFARIGRLPTPPPLKRPTKSEHVVAA